MQKVSLEQLIALNREISALVAAGMPLEQGLLRVSRDLSGPSGEIAQRLAGRLENGASLEAAIADDEYSFPDTYRVLVRAGLQSNNLASALEGYSEIVSRVAELRRMVGLATLYPFFIFIVAWNLFLFTNTKLLPGYDWLNISDQFWGHQLYSLRLGNSASPLLHVAWIVPLIIVLGAFFWWRSSARATTATANGVMSWFNWIPGISKIRRLSCEANFSDLLGLFVENQLPLPEALPLAAKASGLFEINESVDSLAADLSIGKSLTNNLEDFRQLPPQVRLALLSSKGPQGIVDGLQHAAENYRQKAVTRAHTLSLYLPLAITALFGGSVVTFYVFFVFQPYVATLYELTQWW